MCSHIKVRRSQFVRSYPTTMVLTDGSTIRVRYHEPVQIIEVHLVVDCEKDTLYAQMPVKIDELNETERLQRLAERRPPPKHAQKDEFDDVDDFDPMQYVTKKTK